MPEIDPYAIIGVPRTASREDIARAYRALAKRHHPDAGTGASAAMSRVNEAWFILSDTGRRAQWDRSHPVASPAHWASVPAAEQSWRPPAAPPAPASRMDSGWVAAGVVIMVGLVIGSIMLAISLVTPPFDDRVRFRDDAVSFAVPPDWTVAEGVPDGATQGRVIAHLVTFSVDPEDLCTGFGSPCNFGGDAIPSGEASIIITEWREGEPPVPDPVTSGASAPESVTTVGGRPAATNRTQADENTTIAWWQLSPPGFPDRWIEVNAEIKGRPRETDDMIATINQLLDSIDFESTDAS